MKSLSDVIDQIFKEPALRKHLLEGKVLTAWAQAVGPRIAQVARPVSFRAGQLRVNVESAAWRNELSLMRSSLADKINEIVGEKAVKEILLR